MAKASSRYGFYFYCPRLKPGVKLKKEKLALAVNDK
jgi:hypothetical protein